MTKNEITKYTKLGVDKIKDVDILEKDDLMSVSKLSKELQTEIRKRAMQAVKSGKK